MRMSYDHWRDPEHPEGLEGAVTIPVKEEPKPSSREEFLSHLQKMMDDDKKWRDKRMKELGLR